MLDAIGRALMLAGSMGWHILWALILGFAMSGAVQAIVRKETVARVMGDERPRTLAVSTTLGAASSSCSYAAVALARSLFCKGASFPAAMAFEIGSTNLVVELGVILALLLGWQFTAAEFVGGPVMIVLVAVLFRMFLRDGLVDAARAQAGKGLAGSMEGHAAMDMSVQRQGSFRQRLFSRDGFTAVSQVFVMEWAAILRDILVGLLIAGAIGAWVPESLWHTVFLTDHTLLSQLWGPIIGPLIAIASFVCSVGNVPLAAVLWNSGLSFGGVIAFLYADLLILPILAIYRKYYGTRMALLLLGTFYVATVGAGFLVELLFGATGLVPAERSAETLARGVEWNYTTWLNIAFGALAVILVVRAARTGGLAMVRGMTTGPALTDSPSERS